MNKINELDKMGLSPLTENDLINVDGGRSILYYALYAIGWLAHPMGSEAWEMPPGV